ncbi:MAG TPA: phosphate signaling complex protein PhoU [Balneolales bacterium]|nr:phosphate signaling complex protein PhoU [Balneolales bacterium]
MTQLHTELELLKSEALNMWNLVHSQIDKCETALVNFDDDMAHEVITNEKRVNAYELKLDRDCEDIFALFCPVAVDLRFVLAVLKINYNLERLGDIADGISRLVMDVDNAFEKELLDESKVLVMFDTMKDMLKDAAEAFEHEDSKLARSIFKRDEILNEVNANANEVLAAIIKREPDKIYHCLTLLSMIRKLERGGDQVKNIAEETIFYIDAKVLKHKKKKKV